MQVHHCCRAPYLAHLSAQGLLPPIERVSFPPPVQYVALQHLFVILLTHPASGRVGDELSDNRTRAHILTLSTMPFRIRRGRVSARPCSGERSEANPLPSQQVGRRRGGDSSLLSEWERREARSDDPLPTDYKCGRHYILKLDVVCATQGDFF